VVEFALTVGEYEQHEVVLSFDGWFRGRSPRIYVDGEQVLVHYLQVAQSVNRRYVFSVGHSEMHEVDVVVGPTWGLMPRYSRPQLAVTIDGIHSDSVRKVENGRA
jgi:hypothetical protein